MEFLTRVRNLGVTSDGLTPPILSPRSQGRAAGPKLLGLTLVLLCVHLVGALGQGSSLGSDPDHLEYRIKAAFLYNFARFVEWPTDRSTNEADPTLTIAVLGEDPFGPVLDATVEGKLVQGKKLRIKRFRSFAEVIGRCDVLFISTSEKKSLPAILARLRGRSILAVGETEDFLDHGGMIEFQIRGGAVRFDVNLAAAEQAGLHLSSQLLKVASKVKRSE